MGIKDTISTVINSAPAQFLGSRLKGKSGNLNLGKSALQSVILQLLLNYGGKALSNAPGALGTLGEIATKGSIPLAIASMLFPDLRNEILSYVPEVASHGLNLAGKLTQAAGVGAGAALSAVPKSLQSLVPTSQEKQAEWGKTGQGMIADMLMPLGDAAGVATSTAGQAVGSTMTDIANAIRLATLGKRYTEQDLALLDELKARNIDPSTATAFDRVGKNQNRAGT